MKENWVPIKGYEGIYEVSDRGRVRSVERQVVHSSKIKSYLKSGFFLKPGFDRGGYPNVSLCKNGKRKSFKVHRLVFVAFIGTIPSGREINHIDGCKSNNWKGNLEAVTHFENMMHGFNSGLIARKLNGSQVIAIRNRVARGVPQKSLINEYGVSQAAISCIVRRVSWKHI